MAEKSGIKRCTACKKQKRLDEFGRDTSRNDGKSSACRACRRQHYRKTYQLIPPEARKRPGPSRIPRRSGDRKQARSRINHDVVLGLRPSPNEWPCADCGHLGSEKRHAYHHHNGYASGSHNDVIVLCYGCHAARERLWEGRSREANGTFAKEGA